MGGSLLNQVFGSQSEFDMVFKVEFDPIFEANSITDQSIHTWSLTMNQCRAMNGSMMGNVQ